MHRADQPWPEVQGRLRVLRQAAKRDQVALGAFGTYVEQGSKSGMTHAHIVVNDAPRLNGGCVRHFSRGFFPHGVRRAKVDSLAAFTGATGEPSPWITRVWS